MRRATFWFIFGTVLLDMLALGIIAPVFPKLVIQLEGGNDASAANALGLFGTVWAAMQFAFAPVLGALSDRVGRRPVILLSCLGLGLDYAIMALAPTLGWLFVGRVLSGITASSFSTSFAYIADVTEPDERAARFGLLGMAFGLGFILGPAVGGLLGGIGLRAPSGALFLLGIPIGGLFGLTYPALQGLMTRRVGADEQGRLQGAIASVMGIAGVIAPLLFTQVFAAAIGPFRGLGVPGAPFLLAALLLVTAMVVVRRGLIASVVALVAFLGVPSASAQSVRASPGLAWRPRAPLEGSAVVLELSAGPDDSVVAVQG